MESWKLFFCMASFYILIQSGCSGGASGCGSIDDYHNSPNMTLYITGANPWPFNNDSFTYVLIEPSLHYYYRIDNPYNSLKSIFPLLIDHTVMEFLITKKGIGFDTLTIQYEVKPYYYTGNICNDPAYYPKANVKNCYTRNHLFQVTSFH